MNYNKVFETIEPGPKGCWLFAGEITDQGYGRVYIGSVRRNRITVAAHRASLLAAGVLIGKGMVVDHVCRVRRCVNPDHLRVVTPKVNATENSVSAAAINKAKTHCPAGHAYTEQNTQVYRLPDGRIKQRRCKECRRINRHRWA